MATPPSTDQASNMEDLRLPFPLSRAHDVSNARWLLNHQRSSLDGRTYQDLSKEEQIDYKFVDGLVAVFSDRAKVVSKAREGEARARAEEEEKKKEEKKKEEKKKEEKKQAVPDRSNKPENGPRRKAAKPKDQAPVFRGPPAPTVEEVEDEQQKQPPGAEAKAATKNEANSANEAPAAPVKSQPPGPPQQPPTEQSVGVQAPMPAPPSPFAFGGFGSIHGAGLGGYTRPYGSAQRGGLPSFRSRPWADLDQVEDPFANPGFFLFGDSYYNSPNASPSPFPLGGMPASTSVAGDANASVAGDASTFVAREGEQKEKEAKDEEKEKKDTESKVWSVVAGKGKGKHSAETKEPEHWQRKPDFFSRQNPLDAKTPVRIDKHKAVGLNRLAFDETQQWPSKRGYKKKLPVFEPELKSYLEPSKKSLTLEHAVLTYTPRLKRDPARFKQFMEDHGMHAVCDSCKKEADPKTHCNHGWPCSSCFNGNKACKYTFTVDAKAEDPAGICSEYGYRCENMHGRTLAFLKFCETIDASEDGNGQPPKSLEASKSAKLANCDAPNKERARPARAGRAAHPNERPARRHSSPTPPLGMED